MNNKYGKLWPAKDILIEENVARLGQLSLAHLMLILEATFDYQKQMHNTLKCPTEAKSALSLQKRDVSVENKAKSNSHNAKTEETLREKALMLISQQSRRSP